MRILAHLLVCISMSYFAHAEVFLPEQEPMEIPQQQNLAPVQMAPGVVTVIPPEDLRPPADAIMISDEAPPSTAPGILDLFKKASALVDTMAPMATRFDEKRDKVYDILFSADKLLDSSLAGFLERIGRLEDLFTPEAKTDTSVSNQNKK